MVEAGFGLSTRSRRAAAQPISELMKLALDRPELISLAAGFVDNATLPVDDTAGLFAELLGDAGSGRAALQYGTTIGLPELRSAVFEHLTRQEGRPIAGSPDRVVVTNGSQQMLHMLTDALIDAGDVVITAWPSYFVYTAALTGFGATIRAVDTDEQGLIPEALDRLLSGLAAAGQLRRVKMLYLQSYHQNPTGLTLAASRRPEVLEIIRRYSDRAGQRILIVEDAAYRELTYDGDRPGTVYGLDDAGRYVALLQTFSKPFSPGLKTGYGLLPADLIEPVLMHKGGRDFGSSNLCQHLLARALGGGVFGQHVDRLRSAYAVKRDAMLGALASHLSGIEGVSWTRPNGGLYVWLTLPVGVDTGPEGSMFGHALDLGVLFVPGQYCYPPDPTRTPPKHTIRLSFGVAEPAAIEAGIERLGRAVRRAVAG